VLRDLTLLAEAITVMTMERAVCWHCGVLFGIRAASRWRNACACCQGQWPWQVYVPNAFLDFAIGAADSVSWDVAWVALRGLT